MIPLIGITTKRTDLQSIMPTHAVSEAYLRAIQRAGCTGDDLQHRYPYRK